MTLTSKIGMGTRAFPALAGIATTSLVAYDTVGSLPAFRPNPLGFGQWRFVAELIATAGRTAYIQLYNVTDAVQVCELTSASVSPVTVSFDLTPGTTAGFPVEEKTYRVDIHMDAGAAPEAAFCRNARIEFVGA